MFNLIINLRNNCYDVTLYIEILLKIETFSVSVDLYWHSLYSKYLCKRQCKLTKLGRGGA